MEDKPLKGKTALVTGGSRGIGRAISMKLADEGADIIIDYFRKRDTAESAVREITAKGVRCQAIKANLAEPEKIDKLFADIESQFGRLDILINNAASGAAREAMALEFDEWDWTMNVNARAALLCSQRAARLMKDGGWIINISSLGSHMVMPVYTSVGVSKAALEALTKYLAIELAPRGISVNAVSAAAVETEALKIYIQDPDLPKPIITSTPAGRMVRPEDVANLVSFLCSPAATMIRGQVIILDGGFSLSPLFNNKD
jgi:enoyl-[acyl-carrier protein] reductase III